MSTKLGEPAGIGPHFFPLQSSPTTLPWSGWLHRADPFFRPLLIEPRRKTWKLQVPRRQAGGVTEGSCLGPPLGTKTLSEAPRPRSSGAQSGTCACPVWIFCAWIVAQIPSSLATRILKIFRVIFLPRHFFWITNVWYIVLIQHI